MTTPKILPADIYDALEFGALTTCGIGAIRDFRFSPMGTQDYNCPVCVYGLARFVVGNGSLLRALRKAGISRNVNDGAVTRINMRRYPGLYIDRYHRVTFKEWCKELNVVRGE